jgi:hypothetical protein
LLHCNIVCPFIEFQCGLHSQSLDIGIDDRQMFTVGIMTLKFISNFYAMDVQANRRNQGPSIAHFFLVPHRQNNDEL